MGAIVSIVNTITGTIRQIKKDKDADKRAEEKRRLDKIKSPIKPPFFFKTIEDRKKNVTTGPYTVDNIKFDLQRDVLPAGYSLEQLREVGFGDEVDGFIGRREKRIKDNHNQLKDGFLRLKKFIISDFNDLTKEDQRAVEKTDIKNIHKQKELTDMIDKWIIDVDKDRVSDDILNDMFSILNTRLGIVSDAISSVAAEDDFQNGIRDAENLRDSNLMKISHRSWIYKNKKSKKVL